MLFIRSLLFQGYFFVSVALYALLVLLCWPLPFRVRYGLARHWARGMLRAGRFLCGLDYVVEGLEFIPDEPGVIMLKHSTAFETYAQVAFLPTQTWVLKRELKWVPIFGWGLATLNPIAINRRAGRSAVTQVIEQGKRRLGAGIWISIFPEGTRMAPGTTRRYGVSGAALAQETGCRILPVAHNAGDFWPRRSFIKRPGLIRFCIGPPIEPDHGSPRATNLRVQAWIENKMAEISRHGAAKTP